MSRIRLLCLCVPDLKKIQNHLYFFHCDSFATHQMESMCEACGCRDACRAME